MVAATIERPATQVIHYPRTYLFAPPWEPTMRHPILGRLVFDRDNQRWRGHHSFTHLLPLGMPRADREEPLDEKQREELAGNMQSSLDKLKERMFERFGEDAQNLLDALEEESKKANLGPDAAMDEEEDEDFFEDPEDRAAYHRDEARHRQDVKHLEAGRFPISFSTGAERSRPTDEQRAALRRLLKKEETIARQVRQALFNSFQQYAQDEHWRELCALPDIQGPEGVTAACNLEGVQVLREHHDGIAYLLFPVDCDWEQEHGMVVVYHPKTGAQWATHDGLDELIESDEPVDDAEELPGNQELVEAVLEGNEEAIKRLLAQGHDINDVGEVDPYPPLCAAVERLEVDLVKRLLAIGADPGLKDFEGKSALQRARRMLEDLAPKKGDKLMEAAMALARKANPGAFGEMEGKLKKIIRLLEEGKRGPSK